MKISDFDYDLPPAAIAQEPAAERDASRLMLLPRGGGAARHHVFRDLPDLLSPGDLLVVNRSRVFPARLLGRRDGGGAAEVLLVRPCGGGGTSRWEALVRPGRRLRVGDAVRVDDGLVVRIDSLALPPDGRRRVTLECPSAELEPLLDQLGHTPLPPYVRRPDRPQDRERYQTIYAREKGSVAAPTAGLHFTGRVLSALRERGVEVAEIVLHVGPGTFRPVTGGRVEDHVLAREPFSVPSETAVAVAATRARRGRVIAVGTTTVRTLETVASEDGRIAAGEGETALMIVPGFRFRVVDVLLTNFHLPRSSLLLLVAAFVGRERLLEAYAEAVREGYRFYSYGDAMLIR